MKNLIKFISSTRRRQRFGILILCLVVVLGVGVFLWSKNSRPSQAAWWDDNWSYRQTVTVTNNGSAQTNYQVQVVVPTGNLIVAGKMRSDCGDLRFVDASTNASLGYWNEFCRSLGNQNSSVWVTIPSLSSSAQIYMYYGNTTATGVSRYFGYPTGVNVGDGNDQAATVSGTVNLNSWTISGRSTAGSDAFNPASTSLNVAGSSTVIATTSAGLTAGDEILIMTMQAASSPSAGLYETARVTGISGGTLTINHPLVNTYDGTTNKVMVQRVPNYAGVTLNTNATLKPANWSDSNFTGGVLFFRATGTVTVGTGASITASGLGFLGGAGGGATTGGSTGESYDGASSGRGGNGASNGETRAGGRSGDGATASPADGVITGGGGGGGSDGSGNTTTGGGAGGGGGGYAGGGGGGGSNTDSNGTRGTGGAGGGGGAVGTVAGGGGGGCLKNGTAATGNAGGNAGSAGSAASCTTNGTAGAAGSGGSTQGSGAGGVASTTGSGGGGGGGGNYGTATLATLYLGSGGGGGGGANSGGSGTGGGAGGGIVTISANSLTMNLTATIVASGAASTAPSAGGGAGGGGAGGSILVNVGTISQIGTQQIAAMGGTAVAAGAGIAGGGGGGDGRVHFNYSTTTGTTNPTAHTTALPVASSPATEEKAVGPVGFWRLDEGQGSVAHDSTQNGGDGTITEALWQTEDKCVSGKCLWFDGVNDVSTTTSNSALSITGALTASTWIKMQSTGIDERVILSKWDSGTNQRGYALWLNSTDKACFTTDIDGLAGASETICGKTTLSQNVWYLVTAVYNPSNSITIYINGKADGQLASAVDASIFASTANFKISGSVSGWGGVFKGYIDEPKIYNYVRSGDQINLDFNNSGHNKGAGSALGLDPRNAYSSLNQGLIGYWKMDETSWSGAAGEVKDSSNNGNNGTAVSSATTTSAGKFGYAANLNGSSQYVNLGTTPTLAGATSGTIAGWVNSGSFASAQAMYSEVTSSTGSTRVGLFFSTGSKVQIIMRDSSADPAGSSTTLTGATTLATNTWYHVVVTFDSTKNTRAIYVNGAADKLDNTTSFSALGTSTTANIFIGALSTPSNFFNGKIDDVRVYNRALNPVEVAQLYNFGPAPLGYWNFEEGSGQTINDVSGNGNNGNLGFSASVEATDAARVSNGQYGKGLSFNATTANIATVFTGQFTDMSSLTIEAWMYPTSLQAVKIISKRNQALNTGWSLGTLSDGSLIFTRAYNGNTLSCTTGLTRGPSYQINRWNHLAATFQDTGDCFSGVKVFINGVVIPISPSSGNTGLSGLKSDNGIPILFGASLGGVTPFDGRLDEIKIYNYARTEAQVVSDMTGGGSTERTPTGYWKFDEGVGTIANDSTFYGENGTLNGAVWNSNGRFGKAVQLSGAAGSYVNLGDAKGMRLASASAITAWVKPQSVNDGATHTIFSKWGATNGTDAYALQIGTTGKVVFQIGNGQQQESVTGQTVLSANNWYHVAAVFSPGNSLTVYVNGKKDNELVSGVYLAILNSDATNTVIGAEKLGSTNNFGGLIDEVKVYDGALSASDIVMDMNHSSAISLGVLGTSTSDGVSASNSASLIYCVPGDTSACAGPVGEWNFDDGQGTSVTDTSGSGFNLTWNGTGTHWGQGNPGKGGIFNGIDDTARVADPNTNSPLDLTSSLSLSAWVKLNAAVPGGGTYNVISKSSSAFYYIDINSSQVAEFQAGSSNPVVASARTIPVGVWTHIEGVYDTVANTETIYINGRVEGFATGANTDPIQDNNALDVGAYINSSEWFNGSIDTLRIWNYARSAPQVAWEYYRGQPALWWKMDDCTGSTVNDAVSSNSGTLIIGTGAGTGHQDSAGNCITNATTAWYDGRNGKYNSSVNFDGIDDYVKVRPSFLGDQQGSFAFWFYPTNTGGNPFNVQDSAGAFANFFGTRNNSNGSFQFTVIRAGTTNSTMVSQTGVITTNAWNHVVVTSDGSTYKMYVNGRQVNISASAGSNTGKWFGFLTGANSLTIGGDLSSGNFGDGFAGQMDDVRVYSYPLNSYQVQLVYNQGSAVRFGPSTGAP